MHATLDLVPDRSEQPLADRADSAADHDEVGGEQNDRIGDADPEQLPGPPEPPRAERLAHEGLEAAAVAAGAERPLLGDRQVADLARPALTTLVKATADRDPAPDARADRDEDGRVAVARRAEGGLGERKGAGVVDECRRRAERVADARRQWDPRPVPGHVGKERRRAARRVEEAGHADPDRVDRSGRRPDRDEPFDDRVGPVGGPGVELPVRDDLVLLEHDPLDVGGADVEAEVPHRTDHPPSTVSTAPVTNGAVAR